MISVGITQVSPMYETSACDHSSLSDFPEVHEAMFLHFQPPVGLFRNTVL